MLSHPKIKALVFGKEANLSAKRRISISGSFLSAAYKAAMRFLFQIRVFDV